MVDLPRLLVFAHVVFNLVWVGAITSVGITLTSPVGSPRDRGALALRIYWWLATPAFLGSLMMGLLRLVLSLQFYFVQTHFMHGKLLFAVGVIALHHILGGKAKRMASGKSESAGHTSTLVAGLLMCVVFTTFFAVVKPF